MSHELTIKNGTAEMAYVGETPWHGLGQKLNSGASIEEWRKAAGMDWRILRSKVRYAIDREGKNFRTVEDRHVLFRSDTQADLGITSDGYKVVQPGAVLEFFRDLTEQAGFKLETAGTLFGGKRFWALASTGESMTIADARDRVNGYLLLSTSCDGSMATEGRYTNTRVVCHNTLSMAREMKAKVRVTHRSKFDAGQVKKELGIEQAHEAFASAMGNLRRLATVELLPRDALMQTACLFEPKASEMAKEELLKVLDTRAVRRVNELAVDGGLIGGDLIQGTQWGWLNAVTQYVDHEARARSQDNRLASAWFGAGDALKSRAYDMALASLVV
jgi:phage/plasmid-like protein (TIGR03299 family)